jgi:hypothetical protein
MVKYGPPERVYVENEWYDGPRAGIADFGGVPHRFKSIFDEEQDEYLGTFLLWPVDKLIVDLEIDQWCIFVEWNALYESGKADTDSHPAHGNRNARWDEVQEILKPIRNNVPAVVKRAVAELLRLDREARYETSGPDYMLCWSAIWSNPTMT